MSDEYGFIDRVLQKTLPVYSAALNEATASPPGVDGDSANVDYRHFWQKLKMHDWVHFQHRERFFKEIRGERPQFIHDIIASMVAQLQYRDLLKDEFRASGLQYSGRILQDRGYKQISIDDDLVNLAAGLGECNHAMLVAGCQTPKLWRSRVEAAIRVKETLYAQLNIVFCGLHPDNLKERGAVTPDEANEMKIYFAELDNLIPPRSRRFTHFVVHSDDDSRTTEQNVDKFWETAVRADQEHHIIVISSTFHLPRLERAVREKAGSNVRRLTLIGSEHPTLETEVSADDNYIKSMTFEILSHLYSEAMRLRAFPS